MNTALVTFLVHVIVKKDLDTPWLSDSIVYDVFWLFVMNAFVPPLTYIFDPFYLYRLYQRRKIIEQGKECKMTQQQANL